MKIQKISCMAALLGLAMYGSASASSITQHTLQQISQGDSFDINTYGQLDWAIVGVNEKAGGSMISTTGSGSTTTLTSASPGGTTLHFSSIYPYFTYNDGASPPSSAASPGDQAGYQYDEPAVDIFVPAGLTQLTMWPTAGVVGDASYQATLADGTTTGTVSYWAGDATYYLLQLDILSNVAQTLRFSIQHPAIGNPSLNNAGLFAVAANPEASPIPEPASIWLLVSSDSERC